MTEHTLNVGGKTIRYRATTGFMVMRDWTEKKKTEDGEAGSRGSSPAASPAKDDKSKDKDGKDDQPKQKAKVFYVAYTRLDAGDARGVRIVLRVHAAHDRQVLHDLGRLWQ